MYPYTFVCFPGVLKSHWTVTPKQEYNLNSDFCVPLRPYNCVMNKHPYWTIVYILELGACLGTGLFRATNDKYLSFCISSNSLTAQTNSPEASSRPHVQSCCPGKRASRRWRGSGGPRRASHSASTASSGWSTAAPRRPSLKWTYCSPEGHNRDDKAGQNKSCISRHTQRYASHNHTFTHTFLWTLYFITKLVSLVTSPGISATNFPSYSSSLPLTYTQLTDSRIQRTLIP